MIRTYIFFVSSAAPDRNKNYDFMSEVVSKKIKTSVYSQEDIKKFEFF